jgi:hypothetical protein
LLPCRGFTTLPVVISAAADVQSPA